MRWLVVILLVLVGVPGWSGLDRLERLDRPTPFTVTAVPVAPAQRRAGRLQLVGALTLASTASAFGGFSAIALRNDRATLLSDTGNYLSFAIRSGRLQQARVGYLAAGPGSGWLKEDRDSESLALDPVSGAAWVGFERANAIWRYGPGLAVAIRSARPAIMRQWRLNGGAESLARFPDGAFAAIAETPPQHSTTRVRPAALFLGDPTDIATPRFGFGYLPPTGFSPSDATALPDGDLLILNRRWRFPLSFDARVTLVPRAAIRPRAVLRGHTIATLQAPLLTENAEGIAVTRERDATMVWIVTDNDQDWWRGTQLLKFRLR